MAIDTSCIRSPAGSLPCMIAGSWLRANAGSHGSGGGTPKDATTPGGLGAMRKAADRDDPRVIDGGLSRDRPRSGRSRDETMMGQATGVSAPSRLGLRMALGPVPCPPDCWRRSRSATSLADSRRSSE